MTRRQAQYEETIRATNRPYSISVIPPNCRNEVMLAVYTGKEYDGDYSEYIYLTADDARRLAKNLRAAAGVADRRSPYPVDEHYE